MTNTLTMKAIKELKDTVKHFVTHKASGRIVIDVIN